MQNQKIEKSQPKTKRRKKIEKDDAEILRIREEMKEKKNIEKAINELSHDISFLLHAINILF